MNLRVVLFSITPLLIALIVAYLRVSEDPRLLEPNQEVRSWQLEVKVGVKGRARSSKLALQLPLTSEEYDIVSENFVSNGFGVAMFNTADSRSAVWTGYAEKDSALEFYYSAQIEKQKEVTPGKQAVRLAKTTLESEEVKLLTSITRRLRSERLEGLDFIEDLMKEVLRGNSSAALQLRKGHTRNTSRTTLLVGALRAAGVPARVVHGIKLSQADRDARFFVWAEAFHDGHWHSIDVRRARLKTPSSWFAWYRGSTDFFTASGVGDAEALVSVTPLEVGRLGGKGLKSGSQIFSLYHLPVEAQALYRIILVLPLGALVVAFLRCVVGIKTFGTFMPVLIALSFRETELLWGMLLYCIVIAMSLAVRYLFEHLQLLVVPRLTATLTLVVMVILAFSGCMEYFGVNKSLSVALFPIVILTMMVERISIMLEELGFFVTLRQLLVTLAVSALVYLVVSDPHVQYYLFTFPELLLVVLALAILLGRFTGYRLVELYRFRNLLKES